VAWRLDAGGAFGRAPAIATSGGVLLATRRGDVILFDADGRRHGTVSVGSSVEGPAVLVDGRTLIVAADGGRYGLVALDLLAGSRLWRALRGVEVDAGAAVSRGVVVAPALDGTVYGIDFATGEQRWRTAAVPHASHRAPPVVLPDGTVLVASTLGRLVALDPVDGQATWTVELGAPVEEAPAVQGGLLVVPTTRGRLVALDPVTGADLWSIAAERTGDRFFTPTVTSEAVYAGASGGGLVSVGLDGVERWRRQTPGHVAAAPLVVGGRVFAGTMDSRLVVLDAGTGAEQWSHEFPGRVKSAPIAFGAMVLVPVEPGVVWAFRGARQAGSGP